MPIWILLMALLVTPVTLAQPHVLNTVDIDAEEVNYTDIITHWLKEHHPQETFTMKVATVKPILTDRGATNTLAFQVTAFLPTHAQSYILLIKNGVVLAFIDAGTLDVTEEEEEGQEIFSTKDQV